mmetsp:Transcript_37049/g.57930  ORF Transcript_37049/g.57930 Transcript_37049/m.57930 type:complete len:150 (-) Transcript_37049:145-594(-)
MSQQPSGTGAGEACETCCGPVEPPNKISLIEPKVFLANERTFLNWMSMSVTLGSIATALTAFGKADARQAGAIQFMSAVLIITAICFNVYAVNTFFWRRRSIRRRDESNFDDIYGPYSLSFVMLIALSCVFVSLILFRLRVLLFFSRGP